MRSVLFVAILCALVLAGCGGGTQAPTSTAVPPTESSGLPTQSGFDALAATLNVPPPGTLVVLDQNETPNAPTRTPITINVLQFTQRGGIAGINLTILLRGDGTLVRDGQASTVSQEALQGIAALLDKIDFYNLQGTFSGLGGASDIYHYTLMVDSEIGSRTIQSDDGLTPPELNEIYDAIRALNNS